MSIYRNIETSDISKYRNFRYRYIETSDISKYRTFDMSYVSSVFCPLHPVASAVFFMQIMSESCDVSNTDIEIDFFFFVDGHRVELDSRSTSNSTYSSRER